MEMTHASADPPAESVNGTRPAGHIGTGGNGDALSDEELVERSLQGEDDAFRRLYERYRQPVFSAARRIVPDPEEARDVTQEIFISVYRSLDTWDPRKAGFLTWIYRVATNRAIDCWRIRQRRAEVPLDAVSQTQFHDPTSCRATMERTVEHRERLADVRRFLEGLPQPQKRFIVLHFCEGLKLREIAETEGYRLGTVKSVLHRATHTLRLKLRRMYLQRQTHSTDAPFEPWSLAIPEINPGY
jgi:RNA polymerase sigma-70 factor (ECF subfamily)